MRVSSDRQVPSCGKVKLECLCAEVPVGRANPVALYREMKKRFPGHSYLLESADNNPAGERNGSTWGRYSYMGFMPVMRWQFSRGWVHRLRNGRLERCSVPGNPLDDLRALVATYAEEEQRAVKFSPLSGGGFVGYCNYDLVRKWERLPSLGPFDEELPEAAFMVAAVMVIFDHVEGRVRVETLAHENANGGQAISREQAEDVLQEVVSLVEKGRDRGPVDTGPLKVSGLASNFTREAFMDRVARARERILAGDAIQIVLSQRFSGLLKGDAFGLYGALRRINPSPYMFYLDFGPVKLSGASPEMLVRVQDGSIQVCPIAGTRGRGRDPAEDKALEAELQADPKERAEHVMLVDLGRNDVGRVAEARSVTVPMLMRVERYSHVMHLVSRVEGRLRFGKDCFDAFMSAFPAGTVSGAPKIRAMEIIQELEATPRGPYAGAAGWFGFGGNADFCIAIRTFAVSGERLSLQAGAGIVADSDPAAEYDETLRKAAALLRAVEEAGSDDRSHR